MLQNVEDVRKLHGVDKQPHSKKRKINQGLINTKIAATVQTLHSTGGKGDISDVLPLHFALTQSSELLVRWCNAAQTKLSFAAGLTSPPP